jgi:hypothetical protein
MTIGGVIGRVGDSSTVRFFRKVFGFFDIRPLPSGGWHLVSQNLFVFDASSVTPFSILINKKTKNNKKRFSLTPHITVYQFVSVVID